MFFLIDLAELFNLLYERVGHGDDDGGLIFVVAAQSVELKNLVVVVFSAKLWATGVVSISPTIYKRSTRRNILEQQFIDRQIE